MKKSVLVLGANGFLGRYVAEKFGDSATLHHSSDKNPTGQLVKRFESETDIFEFFSGKNFSAIVNCISLTSPEKCEQSPDSAYFVNSHVNKILSRMCYQKNWRYITFSSDAVFSGHVTEPNENSPTSPISVYGKSKYLGEVLTLESNPKALVCRTNFYGNAPSGHSIFNFFFENFRAKNKINGYSDVTFSPAYAAEVANAVSKLLRTNYTGIRHLSGPETLSKYHFALKLAQEFNFSADLVSPVSTQFSEFEKIRSRNLVIKASDFPRLGIKFSNVSEGLKKMRKTGDYPID